MAWVVNRSSSMDSKGSSSNNSGDSSVLPCIYVWKIEGFPLLKYGKYYKSQHFPAGGYKWFLHLFLYEAGGVELGLYLNESDNPSNSRNRVTCELFLRNQRDNNAHITKNETFYCQTKKQSCTYMLVLPEKLKGPSTGYVVDDCFECGVEISNIVPESTVKERVECLRMIEKVKKLEFAWVIKDFAKLTELEYYSPPSTSWGLTWRLKLYPLGNEHSRKEYVALYLELQNTDGTLTTLNAEETVLCDYIIRVVDQIHGEHVEMKGSQPVSKDSLYGSSNFMPRDTIKFSSKGFLVDGNVIIEAKIDIIGFIKSGSPSHVV